MANYVLDNCFINHAVGSIVLENIDLCDGYSYFHHTNIHPFHDEILTTIFILFSTWLYNYCAKPHVEYKRTDIVSYKYK